MCLFHLKRLHRYICNLLHTHLIFVLSYQTLQTKLFTSYKWFHVTQFSHKLKFFHSESLLLTKKKNEKKWTSVKNTYNIQFIPGCGYGCQSMTCRGKSPFFFAWTHRSLTFCMGLHHPSVLIMQYQWERLFSLVLDILCKSSSFYTNSTQKYRIHCKYIYSILLYSIQYANYLMLCWITANTFRAL